MKNETQMKIIFSVFGDEFNPMDFTKYVGFEPTEFWYKGDKIPNRNGILRKESSWDFTTGFVKTLFFDEIIKIFLDAFSTKIEKIKDYIEINKLDVKFFVIVEIEEDTPALFFNKLFLDTVHRLNAEIDIDLYN